MGYATYDEGQSSFIIEQQQKFFIIYYHFMRKHTHTNLCKGQLNYVLGKKILNSIDAYQEVVKVILSMLQAKITKPLVVNWEIFDTVQRTNLRRQVLVVKDIGFMLM